MPVYSIFCVCIICWVFRLCPCWALLCVKNLSMVGVCMDSDSVPRRRCGMGSCVWALLLQSCPYVEALQTLKSFRDWHTAHMPRCLISIIVLTRKRVQFIWKEAPGPPGASSTLEVLINLLPRSAEELYKNNLLYLLASLFILCI